MNYKPLLFCPVIALSACGGGTTSYSTEPFSSLGFADAQLERTDTFTLTIPASKRILRTEGQNTRFEDQDIVITVATDDTSPSGSFFNVLSVTLNGVTYDVTPDPNDEFEFNFEDTDNRLNIEIREITGGAVGYEIFAVLNGELNSAVLITGFDTNPATIDARTGSAIYEGVIDAVLRRNDYGDAFGEGNFTLTADFSRDQISGSGTVAQDSPENDDFSFNPISFNFDPTDIDENGYVGSLSVQTGDLDGTLVESGYQGRFFGTEAGTIGGTYFARIDVDNTPDDTFVEGLFIGVQQDE